MVKSLKALLDGLDVIGIEGDAGVQVSGLAYDSRKVKEGDLFVAIRGVRQDGNVFIRDAVGRGAKAVLTDTPVEGNPGVTIVRVSDSRKALPALSANFFDHPAKRLQMIGVTGTNGKTTTTHLLEGILKANGHEVGVLGTLAYRWGGRRIPAPMTTPESTDLQGILHEMHEDGITHVVMEVSSHSLSLGRVDGCLFRAGVFTNLSQDHLDFHPSMEEYFAAKSLLFGPFLFSGPGGAVSVINADDPHGRRLLETAGGDVWSYSLVSPEARVFVKRADLDASGIRAELATPAGTVEIRSALIGRLNLYNVVAAATTGLALGLPAKAIREGLEAVSHVDGRLQKVQVPRDCGFEVVVDYAHTPDAMEKSLGCLREMTRGRLFVVFGCGGDRDRTKRPLMGGVAARLGDVVVVTSDNPRTEVPESIIREIEPGVRAGGFTRQEAGEAPCPGRYAVEPDRRKAIALALSWAAPGDVIFIGGKGHETYQIVGKEVLHFDDREVVEEYLRSKGSPARQPAD
ncbi:MAG: UDP-N-acetylmuramoyl-L-alanyl-D-glutamate--2,6-diaminopimelate ligase [Syntrophobacteraceae bacterium]|nr:UDP-N-acetylmuramoyl-L-alanyl-D-glutamate--2,6-diaminopimelate ligase [Desulfobacteraceae bacterium]